MFQAYKKKQTTTNYRQKMNKPASASGHNYGIFKNQDTRYMKWLKDKLDERETRDKLISVRNDILEGNKRVNYRNQVERLTNELQRDNLSHNSLEHLEHQINQFRNLRFA